MKYILSGFQVAVYEYSQDTVYKKPLSFFQRTMTIVRDEPKLLLKPLELIRWSIGLGTVLKESLERISKRTDLWGDIGCPVIESSGAYYQQKVTQIYDHADNLNGTQYKKLIDDFVEFAYYLLTEKGVIDKCFGFASNFSVHEGRIVLMDIGETYFDEESFIEEISNRKWTEPSVLMGVRKDFVNYWIEKMDAKFLPYLKK